MTRQEHIKFSKKRALAYVDAGDYQQAYDSMAGDLLGHVENKDHLGIRLGFLQLMAGALNTEAEMRKFIEGFN